MRENFNVSIMLKESMYMIFLSAHSELKALTPGTDGQLAGHPNITRLLEPRRYSLRGPLVGHTYIPFYAPERPFMHLTV